VLGTMEPTPEQAAEGSILVKVLAAVLERLVNSNTVLARSDPGQITKFHALKPPGIGIEAYLERIHKYASCSNECFILALIYIDRLIQRNNFLLTELNVHRVVITAILLAAKFFDDAYYNNAYYSKVGGVLVSEMNGLEVDFLFRINFSLHVQPDVFDKYKAELVAHSINCGLALSPVSAPLPQIAEMEPPINYSGMTEIIQQQQQQQQQQQPVQQGQNMPQQKHQESMHTDGQNVSHQPNTMQQGQNAPQQHLQHSKQVPNQMPQQGQQQQHPGSPHVLRHQSQQHQLEHHPVHPIPPSTGTQMLAKQSTAMGPGHSLVPHQQDDPAAGDIASASTSQHNPATQANMIPAAESSSGMNGPVDYLAFEIQRDSQSDSSMGALGGLFMDEISDDGQVDIDNVDDTCAEELRKLDEDFKKNLMRAKKVFVNRMDNLQRTQVQREAQHKKTLEQHQKDRAAFEKRLQQEEIEQNRRIEQMQKEWDRRREEVRLKQQNDEKSLSSTPPTAAGGMFMSGTSSSTAAGGGETSVSER